MQQQKVSAASDEELKFSSMHDSSGSEFPEPQDQQSSPDQQRLGESGVSFRHDQSRDADLFPSTSAENWMKTGEEVEEGSEVLQPLCLDSEAENDISDADLTESGPIHPKSKKTVMQKQTRLSLSTSERTNLGHFECELCGQAFHGESSLKKHMKSHPSPTAVCPNYELPAQTQTEAFVKYSDDNLCYVCGKTFTTRTHLKRHLLVHTGQKPHCCQECGKRFSRRECLRVHMRVHSVEKPYTCELCGKGFKQRSNMMCHMRTHTGEKPHPCVICSRTFTHKKDMLRHMEVHSMKS